jgi:hypothetical protein
LLTAKKNNTNTLRTIRARPKMTTVVEIDNNDNEVVALKKLELELRKLELDHELEMKRAELEHELKMKELEHQHEEAEREHEVKIKDMEQQHELLLKKLEQLCSVV